MTKFLLSDTVKDNLPILARWLKGAALSQIDAIDADNKGEKTATIYMACEAEQAAPHDIVIDLKDKIQPQYIAATKNSPAKLVFDFDNLPMAHALIAETIRGQESPAVGEPSSAKMMDYAAKIARSNAAVLIQGETGTGKEGMARFVHKMSGRADKPFIAVNCAALPETMVEAILFGHKKGAFTGANATSEGLFRAADGGTLFLDEISELPLDLQAKILRALQEGEILPVGETQAVTVDSRIIAATNRNIDEMVANGEFREDLYWRLNVMPLVIAPLNERRQDIRAIASAMLIRLQKGQNDFAWLTPNALDALKSHYYSGNARELHNILQRALVLRNGAHIEKADLGLTPSEAKAPCHDPVPTAEERRTVKAKDLHSLSRAAEYDAIERALEENDGNRKATAKMLGISERTLRYRLADMREMASAA